MSPRAAWRLESLGFQQVYDYSAGKADWGSDGRQLVGSVGPRVGEVARSDVPICRIDERLPEVRERVQTSGWDACIVVNERGVVLGRLGRHALRANEDVPVERAMAPGPSTIRPSARLEPVANRMIEGGLSSALVTRSDGTLVGLLLREDAEALTAGAE